jgi:hypothetical protein
MSLDASHEFQCSPHLLARLGLTVQLSNTQACPCRSDDHTIWWRRILRRTLHNSPFSTIRLGLAAVCTIPHTRATGALMNSHLLRGNYARANVVFDAGRPRLAMQARFCDTTPFRSTSDQGRESRRRMQ